MRRQRLAGHRMGKNICSGNLPGCQNIGSNGDVPPQIAVAIEQARPGENDAQEDRYKEQLAQARQNIRQAGWSSRDGRLTNGAIEHRNEFLT